MSARKSTLSSADFLVTGGGTLFLVRPLNDAARRHLDEHLDESAIWYAGGVAVEHRYIEDLVEQLREDGFDVI